MKHIETKSLSSMRIDDKNEVKSAKFPLTVYEIAGGFGVVLCFAVGLIGVYVTLPDSDYSFLKFPKTLADLHILRLLINFFCYILY